MSKNYRIGFDIGIGSVGWSILENDPITEEPTKILKLGVRTFDANEILKTGESVAKSRREKRGVHRRTRRRAFRMSRLKTLIKNVLGVDCDVDLKDIQHKDVYELRFKALDEKVSNAELSKIILNIAKRRGFQSNRKDQTKAKEDGKLLKAIEENAQLIVREGYRTIGEAIYKDKKFAQTDDSGKKIYLVRNHSGDYKNCFKREELITEMKLILNTQRKLGNNLITQEFSDLVVEIFSRQRNYDEGPGKPSPYSAKYEIGNCTFYKDEKRAPKGSFTFEYFTALSKINSLKIGEDSLTKEQKEKLYDEILAKKELKFSQLRKMFAVPEDKFFNLCRYGIKDKKGKKKEEQKEISFAEMVEQSENTIFVKMHKTYEICSKLGIEDALANKQIINEVAYMLSTCKSDATIDNYVENNDILSKLSDEQKEKVKELNCDKFGSLSIRAMEEIIPHLLNGERYDIACKSAGFNHSSFGYDKKLYLKGPEVEERLKDITSNVVKRSVNQTLRILNEIIKKYGSPQYVTIELARELAHNFKDRKLIEDRQEKNHIENEKAKEDLAKEFNLDRATHFDLIKYRLYKDQDGKCMYSGKTIEFDRLFEPNYVQVDHIIPYSRSMNDSYTNKVLVLASENQNKGNRTPFEYFGADAEKWNNFAARVSYLKSANKISLLLKQKFSEDEENAFIERNLNDTKYMSKFLYDLMNDLLQMAPSKHKKQVKSVNGAVTNYLRKIWGINKFREDGDIHHAVDATIIATVTDGQIQKITKYNKMKEIFVQKEDKFINRKTGEVMSLAEKEEYEKEGIDLLAKRLPPPYENFIRELEIRSSVKYKEMEFSADEKLELAKMGYENEEIDNLKPVFVSRMKTVKFTGAIHEETMMSTREYAQTKRLIKTVPIEKLTLSNKPETVVLKGDKYPNCSIENYYNPIYDRLLYLKLKECLVENGVGEKKKLPPKTIIHKPKKDGTDGPIVRSVKVYEKANMCVITPNGAAANDKMHRVDVFKKDGKFYLCPVYMSDVYAKRLPNKVIEIGKEWKEIDKTFEFLFSLYRNDLIKVKNNSEIKLSKNFKNPDSKKDNEVLNKEIFLYYSKTGITTASITAIAHDNCYKIDSLGVKTLVDIEKYYVDIMGNIFKAPKEERKGF